MRTHALFRLLAAIAVTEFAGVLGSFFTAPAIPGWYRSLPKPAFTPPSWVFGPVWIALYLLMGIALFLVWQNHSQILKNLRMIRLWKIGMALFFFQLALNAFWSALFFGLKNPGAAFFEIVFLWLAVAGTIAVFFRISKPAAWLLIPYILWVSFAAYLNFAIWRLPAAAPKEIACTQEAKLCTDGSYVSRTGPNCSFAPCPKEDVIAVDHPRANERVSSPLVATGKARGTWFFEATFPVALYDAKGMLIVQNRATAESDWTTEAFVPFAAQLEFHVAAEQPGTLVLKKDNPSGLPEKDDEIRIPVILAPNQ